MNLLALVVRVIAVCIVLVVFVGWLRMDLHRWACPRCWRELPVWKKFIVFLPYLVMVAICTGSVFSAIFAWCFIGLLVFAGMIDAMIRGRRIGDHPVLKK